MRKLGIAAISIPPPPSSTTTTLDPTTTTIQPVSTTSAPTTSSTGDTTPEDTLPDTGFETDMSLLVLSASALLTLGIAIVRSVRGED